MQKYIIFGNFPDVVGLTGLKLVIQNICQKMKCFKCQCPALLTFLMKLTVSFCLFQYFVFTGVLAMVTCAVFLRLNSVLKLAVLLLMIAIYSLLTEAFYTSLFIRYDTVHHNTE